MRLPDSSAEVSNQQTVGSGLSPSLDTCVVATVAVLGGPAQEPGLTIFAQYSEKNTLCRPAQISNIVHFALV